MNKEFTYKITKHIATLSVTDNGYSTEVNYISFNEGSPKLDIRKWKDGRMLKGVSLTPVEVEALKCALNEV